MTKEESNERTSVGSTDTHLNVEFDLDEKTQKAIIECIQRTGKVSLQLRPVGASQLPGRGLLEGVEGKLID
jgi:hypothetical protein